MNLKKKWIALIKILIVFILILISITLFKQYKTNDNGEKIPNMINDNTEKIPIFTFHRIVPEEIKNKKYVENEWVQSVEMFDKQMKYLYDNGYKTISIDEFYAWYIGECEFPKKTIVITFDDENLEDYYVVLPVLKKYNFKATSFIVGSRAESTDNEYNPNKRKFITKNIINQTSEIYPNLTYQSHTYDLHTRDSKGKPILYNYSEEQILEDFNKNSEYKFEYLAYPYGAYNKEIISALKENNYKLAFTFEINEGCATRENDRYKIPRININGFSDVYDIKKWLDL